MSNDTLEKILLQLAANSREEESTQITNLKNKVAFLQQKIDVLVNAKGNSNDKPKNNFFCTYCKMSSKNLSEQYPAYSTTVKFKELSSIMMLN